MSVELVAKIRAELDRVGARPPAATAGDYAAIIDQGEGLVTLKGSPRSPQLRWRGSAEEALARLAKLSDGAGLEAFWSAFGKRAQQP